MVFALRGRKNIKCPPLLIGFGVRYVAVNPDVGSDYRGGQQQEDNNSFHIEFDFQK